MAKDKSGKLRVDDEEEVPAKKKSGLRIDADDAASEAADESEAPAAAAEAALGAIGTITPPKESGPVNAAGEVEDLNRLCKFACLKELDHAPVVGTFRGTDYGIDRLKVNFSYTLPLHVARHFVDKGLGTIVG